MGGCLRPRCVLIGLLACLSSSACLRKTEFHCTTDADCSGGGFCEATSFCSFADTECAGGRRYGDFAGALSNQCVGAVVDGGVDDAPPADAPDPGNCPANYATIAGGGTHRYLRVNMATWTSQRDRCAADGANVYLAIPNDMAELQGITGLGAAALTWVGINDRTTEMTFETVRGGAANYLPWKSGEPNNNGEQDCVAAIMSTPEIETDRCGDSYVAVCECEP